MPRFINKLCQFSYLLGEKYRLVGRPIFSEIELIFRLLGHIASSQSKVSALHNQQMMAEVELLCFTNEQRKQAADGYLVGQRMTTECFEASLRFFQAGKLAEEMLLQCCWRMIWSDRHLGMREYQLVHLWGYWLGWSRPSIEALGANYRPVYITDEHQQALTLLGVTLNSTPEIIKLGYKKQLSQFHPDKVIGAGGTINEIHEATEQTTKIHEAYILIRMLHNF